MHAIRSKNIWGIVKRTLNKVDPRLVEHGERVAYIALKILEEAEGEISHEMLKNVLLVCLIHDIGAYKTEEIDCIVEFESRNVWEHSIYVSLFLKMYSPLSEYTEAVLYHHADYCLMKEQGVKGRTLFLADVIHLADRTDLLWQTKAQIREKLEERKGREFSEFAVETLLRAEEKYQIGRALKDGSFEEELEDIIEKMRFTEDEQRTTWKCWHIPSTSAVSSWCFTR